MARSHRGPPAWPHTGWGSMGGGALPPAWDPLSTQQLLAPTAVSLETLGVMNAVSTGGFLPPLLREFVLISGFPLPSLLAGSSTGKFSFSVRGLKPFFV